MYKYADLVLNHRCSSPPDIHAHRNRCRVTFKLCLLAYRYPVLPSVVMSAAARSDSPSRKRARIRMSSTDVDIHKAMAVAHCEARGCDHIRWSHCLADWDLAEVESTLYDTSQRTL